MHVRQHIVWHLCRINNKIRLFEAEIGLTVPDNIVVLF